MDLTISRPIQIFALVAVVAIAGGGGMLAMKPKHAAAPPVLVTKPTVAPASIVAASTSKPVGARGTAAPAAIAAAPTTPKPKAVVRVVGTNGLPLTINAALKKHAVVIVSVFDPESSTDAISYAEAKAGANSAGVGFVGISLLDNALAAALTSALPSGGLLPAPGVLIYRRPGTLVQRIDGFTDRDAVAQAAASSKTAAPMTGMGS
jgi:hypothetical protein